MEGPLGPLRGCEVRFQPGLAHGPFGGVPGQFGGLGRGGQGQQGSESATACQGRSWKGLWVAGAQIGCYLTYQVLLPSQG